MDEQGTGGGLAAVGAHGGAGGNADRRTKISTTAADVGNRTTASSTGQTCNHNLDIGVRGGSIAAGLAVLCFLQAIASGEIN